MKTLNWFGFIAVARTDKARKPGRLARILEMFSRGSIPVDGCNVLDQKPRAERRPEPVRWGNFR
jgi:hypothetical protein